MGANVRRKVFFVLMVALLMGCAAPPPAPPPAPPRTATPLPTATDAGPQPCPTSIAGNVNSDATLALQAPTQTALRLCPLELALHLGLDVQNPYDPDEIDLRVTFTSPAGEQVIVPAFYFLHQSDPNQSGWRVRFTPAIEGEWQAVAQATSPQGTFASDTISFNVSPRDANGFVRLHPGNPRYLAFDDGQTFFPIGVNLGWWRDDALREYERWLDALQANGANTARIWMAPWSFGIEWQDTGLGNYDNRQLRAHWLDEVIKMAEQRGIYLVIGLIPDREFRADGLWGDNPYNTANGGMLQSPADFVTNDEAKEMFKRRLRYIAARWGYSPNILAWEWWNEVETTRIETPALKPWIEEMTAHLRQFDVNRHLITTSYVGNGDDEIWRMPEIDLMQRHEYNETPKWLKPIPGGFRLTPNAPAKPLLFGEFGYSPAGEPLTPATKDGIHLHNALWASAFNGFGSTAMYWWWDDFIDAGNLWPRFKGIATFLAEEDLAALAPITATASPGVTAMALANTDHALLWLRNNAWNQYDASFKYDMSQSTGEPYVFEPAAPSNITVTLDNVSDGVWDVEWIDTETGLRIITTQAIAKNNVLTLAAPATATDIAAKMFRMTSRTLREHAACSTV